MKVKLVCILFLVLLISLSNSAISLPLHNQKSCSSTYVKVDDFNEVCVTYVGNAGFLITVGDKKILIDAIFKGYKGYYELPENIREKIRLGQPPLDIALVHGNYPDAVVFKEELQKWVMPFSQ